MKHYVVYSHGFGVRKDGRGLLTDIAAAIPDAEHIFFNYNDVDETSNTLTVSPLHEQAARLQTQLAKLDRDDVIIDIVAHSQGCIVTALASPNNIRRVLFLAPPDNVDTDRLVGIFGNRPDSVIDLNGESRIPRRDGSTTIIPASYWKSLKGLDVVRLYNELAQKTQIKLYTAEKDEILGVSDFSATTNIEVIELPGRHDFKDEARENLVQTIKEALI